MKTFCKVLPGIDSAKRNFEWGLWERENFDKDPVLSSFSYEEKFASKYQTVGACSPSPTGPVNLLSENGTIFFFNSLLHA